MRFILVALEFGHGTRTSIQPAAKRALPHEVPPICFCLARAPAPASVAAEARAPSSGRQPDPVHPETPPAPLVEPVLAGCRAGAPQRDRYRTAFPVSWLLQAA